MITIDEAIKMTESYHIDFPENWKDQILKSIETSITSAATKGKDRCTVKGTVTPHNPASGYGYGQLYLTTDQFSEIVGEVKKNGFKIEEDFKLRFDGQPLSVDVSWSR